MRTYLWVIFFGIASLSALPVARMDIFNASSRYKYFKYLSIAMFAWTGINYIKFVSLSARVVYYAQLTVYPLVFLITALIFLSLLQYLGKRIPKIIFAILILFFLADAAIAYTNDIHHLFLDITNHPSLTYAIIRMAPHGLFFYIHTAVCYTILIIAMISIIVKLYGNLRKDQDVFPFVIMIFALVIGIATSITHIFITDLMIDPTYIALVLLTTILYFIFYIRDVKLMLKVNGNEFILHNLREMYLLVNHRGIIVSASNELLNKFSINLSRGITFDDFMKIISKRVVVLTENSKNNHDFDESKLYLHMMEKQISLPLLKHSGKFYLFYDETQNQKYINDINYVMTHDLMTTIYNRNYFESIESEIEKRYQKYTLVMFDLDGLKLFNDYLGHEAGDQLLIRFANALKVVVNKYSGLIPIRMGGDEFLLIAPNKDMNDIEEILYDLKIITNDKDLLKHVGFSYGYSQNNFSNKSFKKVMTEADTNQYSMKMLRKKAKIELENFLKSITG